MHPPSGYHSSYKVCKLQKALYGLKQTPRTLFAKFNSTLTWFGFLSSLHYYDIFTWKSDSGIVILLLYVDDMIITGDNKFGTSALQKYLT